jgi:hypothetical protein
MLISKATTRSTTRGRRVASPLQLALADRSRKRESPPPSPKGGRAQSPIQGAELNFSQASSGVKTDTTTLDSTVPPSPEKVHSDKKARDTSKLENATPSHIRALKDRKEADTAALLESDSPPTNPDADASGGPSPGSRYSPSRSRNAWQCSPLLIEPLEGTACFLSLRSAPGDTCHSASN